MSASGRPAYPTTRRERRAAQRLARHEASRTDRRSVAPVAAISVAAIILGLIGVLAFVIASGATGRSLPAVTAAGAVAPPSALRDGRSLGDPSAPVLIEAYEDPQCPACGAFTATIEPFLMGRIREGLVRYTYRDLAFLGPESIDAAVAMRVADALGGRFWDVHALVFANQHLENQGAFSRDRLADMAVHVGIERDTFLAGLDDPAFRDAVLAESSRAAQLGIARTPTLLVNGELVRSVPDWESLRGVIDAAAQQTG